MVAADVGPTIESCPQVSQSTAGVRHRNRNWNSAFGKRRIVTLSQLDRWNEYLIHHLEMLFEELKHLHLRITPLRLRGVHVDILDSQLVHLGFELFAKVRMMDELSRSGFGRWHDIGFAVNHEQRWIIRGQVRNR